MLSEENLMLELLIPSLRVRIFCRQGHGVMAWKCILEPARTEVQVTLTWRLEAL